jgi:CheY-like chemotaxis protein/DNA-binding XRE family transcriptional regulator
VGKVEQQTNDQNLFGNSVKIWRELRGLSQEQLAERVESSRTQISDIERGERDVSLQVINKLARALDVAVAALFPLEAQNKIPGTEPGSVFEWNMVSILLVEDSVDDIDLTTHAFQQAHFINLVHVARDGAEALDYLFCRGKHSGRRAQDVPDVILLDLNLPKVNGLEVLEQIKANQRTKLIRVVVLTSSSMFSDMEECKRLGATSYIVKPVNFHSLSKITPHLNLEWALLKKAERVLPDKRERLRATDQP